MQPNRDEKGRLRSKTVAFRVSPEEYHEIQMLSDISGFNKQDYLLLMCRGLNVTVHPNIRVQKYLDKYLVEIRDELRRLASVSAEDDVLAKLEILFEYISHL